jgi:hypothetical protein
MPLLIVTTGVLATLHSADEKGRERKVAEVIGPQLELEAVGGLAPRRRHQACVVDEKVEPLVLGQEPLGEGPDRLEVREVQWGDLGRCAGHLCLDLAEGQLTLGRVATGEHHPGSGTGELSGGHQPQSAIGSGDDCDTVCLVRDLIGRPLAAHGLVSPTRTSGVTGDGSSSPRSDA